jgi:serine/threonine-protein kinase HipA
MRSAIVLFKDQQAGKLVQHDDGTFTFSYFSSWMSDISKPAISLTLPKIVNEYHSKEIFPFFYNMLPEGSNKQTICKKNKIDKDDYFSLLLAVASYDTIGAVRVIKN